MPEDAAKPGDLETLLALNDDYIRSVQRGAVRRLDEILAGDFLCSNPDGSLVDKRQFLEQRARPVTISGLAAQDVKVRIMGRRRAHPRAHRIPHRRRREAQRAIHRRVGAARRPLACRRGARDPLRRAA